MLTLARAAALNGRFDAAEAAAGEALQHSAAGSADEARGRLYLGAGRIFSDAYDAAVADLQGIASAKLDRSDAALLAAVRNVAVQLRAAPAAASVVSQAAASGDASKDGEAATITKVEDALRRTDSLVAADGSRAP